MTETQLLIGDELPDDVRQREVVGDPNLSTREKELRMNSNRDEENVTLSSEIKVVVKWALSVPESNIRWVRVDSAGRIVAVKARVPRGYIHLKPKARKSNQLSQMVSYGNARGENGGNN